MLKGIIIIDTLGIASGMSHSFFNHFLKMKIGFIEKKKQPHVCVAADSGIIILEKAVQRFGKRLKSPPIPPHLFSHPLLFIENFPKIKKTIREILAVAESEPRKNDFMLSPYRAKLKAPVPGPGTIYCLARNYSEHILEFKSKVVEQDKMVPPIFIKPRTCVTGPGGPVLLSRFSRKVDWEAELAVVVGKRARHIAPEKALQYVMGYTCMLDISERGLKIRERTEDREKDRFFDWLNGKWMDTFAPLGPWIVTRDEIPDPQNLDITLSVNGIERQNSNTSRMIFSVADILSYLSRIVTLMPGDIISTGTPSGVGAPTGTFLKHGDSVEMQIEKVGNLGVKVKQEP